MVLQLTYVHILRYLIFGKYLNHLCCFKIKYLYYDNSIESNNSEKSDISYYLQMSIIAWHIFIDLG